MRVAVVGTGLIGGSVGLALARRGHEIVGLRPRRRTHHAGEGARAVTEIAPRLEDAVHDADVAIVAVPVGQVVDTAVRALDAGAAIVTDVGSVKGPAGRRDRGCPPRALGSVRGRSPDGRIRARRCRRRRCRPVRRRHVGADADSDHDATVYTSLRSLIRDLRAEVVTVTPAAPRRARRARQPRAPARGQHTDGRRDRTRRGAPDAAAARGRWLPRHDANRGRASRHLARHPCRQSRRGARRARRVPRRAAARGAISSPVPIVTDCSVCCSGPGRRGATCPWASR